MSVSSNELGDLLIDLGLITSEDLSEAVQRQKETGERLTLVLSQMGLVSERQLKDALELQFGVNFVNLSAAPPADEFVRLVPEEIERKFRFVPVSKQGNQFTIAMVDPDDLIAADAIREHLQSGNFKKLVCTADDFEHLMRITYEAGAVNAEGELLSAMPTEPIESIEEQAPVADSELQAAVALPEPAEAPQSASKKIKKKPRMSDLFEEDDEFAQPEAREEREITQDLGEVQPPDNIEQEHTAEHDLAELTDSANAQTLDEEDQLREKLESTGEMPGLGNAPTAETAAEPPNSKSTRGASGKAVRQSFSSLFSDDDDDDFGALEPQSLVEPETLKEPEEAPPPIEAPTNKLLEHILQEAAALDPFRQEEEETTGHKASPEADSLGSASRSEPALSEPDRESDLTEPDENKPFTIGKKVRDGDGSPSSATAKKLRSLFDDDMDEEDLFSSSEAEPTAGGGNDHDTG